MNQAWQDFLVQQGARINEGCVLDFGELDAELMAAREGTVRCDLSQFGIIRVNGEEAKQFLQNLLSNDISAVNASTAQLSSFNTAKGRMLATFLIWQQHGDYMLQLPRPLVAAMQKKLSMYVLRAKVKVSDASDDMVCLGISGPEASILLQQQLGISLPQPYAVLSQQDLTVIGISPTRYLCCTPAEHAPALWNALATTAMATGSPGWDWLNINEGIPVVSAATQEQFVLQMANLDLLNGVSFKKGCYPGQEIVARTHYLGKQKRRMYLAHVTSAEPPKAGDELFSDSMAGQACGMVMNAGKAPGGGYDLLAVLQINSHTANDVHLQTATGEQLQFRPLPYHIPAEESK